MKLHPLTDAARWLTLATAVFFFACSDGEPEPEPEPECTTGAECSSGVCGAGGTCQFPACNDSVLNGQETDVDCGGNCAKCADGASCSADGDCSSGTCADGTCSALKTYGEECAETAQCEIDFTCEPFDGTSVCTKRCTDSSTCDGLVCLRGFCTPDDYCDDPDGDGIGIGPGCSASQCDLCDADNATCVDNGDFSSTCVCNVGFEGDGTTCIDVDECAIGIDTCSEDATCTNTDGGFECTCDAGFTGDGTTCDDVNECADAAANNCDANATCTNTDGGFECTCPPGAQDLNGDGTSCSSVDECLTQQDDCSPFATCTDTPQSFDCACNVGYTDLQPGNPGRSCADRNECLNGDDDCVANAVCANTDGGFTCACPPGSFGDGRASGSGCVATDPCAGIACGANSECVVASATTYDCVCDAGFVKAGNSCVDVDECINAEFLCDENSTCTNSPGSYSCACDAGYEDVNGDGTLCRQINECTEGTDQCDANATCTDTDGSYTCACDAGYIGDGFSCRLPVSCLELLNDQPSTRTGVHSINTGAGGDIQVWCDMSLDGGGYTFYKHSQPAPANARQAEATCAALGMQLFITRSDAHAKAAYRIATNANFGPSASANYMRIMGIYPNRSAGGGFTGSTCLNTPMRSGNAQCDWAASDDGPFYVHNSSSFTEPNGDCSTDASMYYSWSSSGTVTAFNDIPSPGYTSAEFMCDTADKKE